MAPMSPRREATLCALARLAVTGYLAGLATSAVIFPPVQVTAHA